MGIIEIVKEYFRPSFLTTEYRRGMHGVTQL